MPLSVVVVCECSGTVRDAFAARGHRAVSVDTQPDRSGTRGSRHRRGDATCIERGWWEQFDIMVAHPPCTYLSWVRNGSTRDLAWGSAAMLKVCRQEAIDFVRFLHDLPVPRYCMENPRGRMQKLWAPETQVIQPWMFGHPFTKATCLWLKGLPPLEPTARAKQTPPARVRPWVGGYGARGQSLPGAARSQYARSKTFPGVAAAMADQWGPYVEEQKKLVT